MPTMISTGSLGRFAALGALVAVLAACSADPRTDAARGPDGAGNNPNVLLGVADAAWNAGDTDTALALYRRAATAEPGSTAAKNRYGAALVQAGAPQEAIEVYRRVLAAEPKNVDASRGMGNALLSLGQPALAAGHFAAALQADPKDWRTMNSLGVVRDMEGNQAEAQQLYTQALALAPDSAAVRNNLGLSLAMSGNYAEAIRVLEPIGRHPRALPRHTLNLALVYGLANQPERAAQVARAHLDEASVQRNLSYYATLRGMDDEARRKAMRTNPNYFPLGPGNGQQG